MLRHSEGVCGPFAYGYAERPSLAQLHNRVRLTSVLATDFLFLHNGHVVSLASGRPLAAEVIEWPFR